MSEGSVSNYLEELVDEKKIRKVRDENSVYYCPPAMSPPVKIVIFISIFCACIILPLFYIYNYLALPVISPLLGFYIGVILICFIWSVSKPQKNSIFKRKKEEKEAKNGVE